MCDVIDDVVWLFLEEDVISVMEPGFSDTFLGA